MNPRKTLRPAAHGAVVWTIYGITETFLSVASPLIREVVVGLAPSLVPSYSRPYVSPSLTALVLLLYPLLGAALNSIVAFALPPRPEGSRDANGEARAWTGISCLLLCSVFAINASVTIPRVAWAAALPIGLSVWRIRSARERSATARAATHPATIVMTLIGTAFILQPRPYIEPVFQAVAAFAFALVMVSASTLILRRFGSGDGPAPHPVLLISLALAAFGGSALLAMIPGGSRQTMKANGALRRGQPNIILITIDTVRADHLSVYGYQRDTSPNLRALSSTATIYRRAIAASNWTLPSHASIFSGVLPHVHGAHESAITGEALYPVRRRTHLLAEYLAGAGYTTRAYVANYVVLLPSFGFNRGFSSYDYTGIEDFFTVTNRPYLFRGAIRSLAASFVSPRRRETVYASAEDINNRALHFLESSGGESQRPFFLFLNYMDAHAPYLPPPPFDRRYPGKDDHFKWSGYHRLVDEVAVRHVRPLRPREFAHLTSQYDGGIAYLDDRLGFLIGRLKMLGLFDNSLIVVTSDHGEAFGERSMLFHGTSTYQNQVHVPLIVKYPRQSTAAVSDTLVSGTDLLPTVLDVIGATKPRITDGMSLRDPRLPKRAWIAAESYRPRDQGQKILSDHPTEIALFGEPWKAIFNTKGSTEIYDPWRDSDEKTNLSGRLPVPAEWNSAVRNYLDAEAHARGDTSVKDPEILQRLKALGYIH